MHEANAIAARLRGQRYASRSGPHKRTTVSPRALEVLAYARAFFAANDQLPPNSAVTQAFGWASDQSANAHLHQLARFGYLEKNAVGKWRFSRATAATMEQANV